MKRTHGQADAEIIRRGIPLAATADRVWEEPLFSRGYEGPGRTLSKDEVRDAVSDAVGRGHGSMAAA